MGSVEEHIGLQRKLSLWASQEWDSYGGYSIANVFYRDCGIQLTSSSLTLSSLSFLTYKLENITLRQSKEISIELDNAM